MLSKKQHYHYRKHKKLQFLVPNEIEDNPLVLILHRYKLSAPCYIALPMCQSSTNRCHGLLSRKDLFAKTNQGLMNLCIYYAAANYPKFSEKGCITNYGNLI